MGTYYLGEPRLEVVESDVVLNGLGLRDEGKFGLDQRPELLLGKELKLVDLIQVLLNDGDARLLDVLLDDERCPFLSPRLPL